MILLQGEVKMINKAIIIGLVSSAVMVTALGTFPIISPKTYTCGTDVYCPEDLYPFGKFVVRHHETNKPVTGIIKKETNGIFIKASVKDGYLDGNLKRYDDGHLHWDYNFKNGKQDGLCKEYRENGQLLDETPYKDGEPDGISKNYYENGQLEGETTYKDGEPDGIQKRYYENGQLHMEATWKDGRPDGSWKKYDKSGQLEWERTLKDGKTVECRGFCIDYDFPF